MKFSSTLSQAITIFLLLTLTIAEDINKDTKQNPDNKLCTLRMALNRKDAFFGQNLIVTNGIVDKKWSETSENFHISTILDFIQYFYVLEITEADITKHDIITTSLKVNATDLVEPVSTSKTEVSKEKSFDHSTIEVKYNCKAEAKGVVKFSLEVKSHDCPTFTIHWLKVCKPISIY